MQCSNYDKMRKTLLFSFVSTNMFGFLKSLDLSVKSKLLDFTHNAYACEIHLILSVFLSQSQFFAG